MAQAPIITFYSYKGGTGRTMGLANTAWIMASNGLRVLVVDWDLEAPGLHRFFHPFLPDRELRTSSGVIDLLWEFATSSVDPHTPHEPRWHEKLAAIQPYTMSVEYPFPRSGTIDLVPAGRQNHLYATLACVFHAGRATRG
jgi:Mrp family chromosome partitioning ATPase